MTKNLMGTLALCLVAILASPALGQHVQLLQNANMNDWTNGPNSAPDHWSNVMADSIFATQNSDTVHSRNYSARVTWISPTQANCEFLADPIAVVPDSVYACTLWVYDNDPAGRVSPVFAFDNVPRIYSNLYSVDNSDWQSIVYSVTAPAGAATLRVLIRAYDVAVNWDGNATVYVDDFVLWGPQVSGNIPPSISPVNRYPYPNIYPTDIATVRATIIDSDGIIIRDSLYYRVLPSAFAPVPHDSIAAGGNYWYTIGQHPVGDSIEYYVIAVDDDNARSQSPTRGYTVLNPNPSQVTIYALQHTINESSLPDCYPSDSINTSQTITGKVVGRYDRPGLNYRNRFFVQDNTIPWSGIYVYSSLDSAQVGDSVTISGIVSEYFGETELGSITSHIKHSSGRPLPAPNIITCATLGTDSCSATAEPYEGMIIQINNITVIDSAGFGDFWATDATGDSCLIMDDLYVQGTNPPTITIGDTYGFIRGIGRYSYGQYRIAPRFAPDVNLVVECSGSNIFDVEFTFDPGSDTADCWPSPDTGQIVDVCGVVTAVTQGNLPRFYMQDQNNTAWGGIYVFDFILDNGDTIDVHLGDYVEIVSRLHEYYGWTELDSVLSYSVLATNQPLPDTAAVTVNTFRFLCDFSTEPYEDILVRLNTVTVLSDNGNGEIWIRDNSTTDSIRIDNDLWLYGSDQPVPPPSPGATYDWIVGVVKWQGRQGAGYERGWVVLPRFASDFEQLVIPAPVVEGVWPVNNNVLAASFDRIMDPVTTENPDNYSTAHGLSITAADLDSTGTIVYLSTGNQPNNALDSLIVVNVCDPTNNCITTPVHKLYHSGITPIMTVEIPNPGGDTSGIYGDIVTVKAVVVADTSMSVSNNLFINDNSGPPYNGLNVYLPYYDFGPYPAKGDTIVITGHVGEYFSNTQLLDINDFRNMRIIGTGPDPVPAQVTAGDLHGPGMLLYTAEELENVLCTVCDSLIVTNPAFDTRGFMVRSLTAPSDSFIVHREPPSQTRYSYVPIQGDIIVGLTGVFRYRFDYFRLMPRYDADFNSYGAWCGGGCDYVVGDANGSGVFNGLDVTYSVVYFKGGPPPPYSCDCPPHGVWFVAGDVNGNCAFNGIDVTYMVVYFKGGPPPIPCPDCPPTIQASGANPAPLIVPQLKSRTNTTGRSQE